MVWEGRSREAPPYPDSLSKMEVRSLAFRRPSCPRPAIFCHHIRPRVLFSGVRFRRRGLVFARFRLGRCVRKASD